MFFLGISQIGRLPAPSSALRAMVEADVVELFPHPRRGALFDVVIVRQGADAIELTARLPASELGHDEQADEDPEDGSVREVLVELFDRTLQQFYLPG